MNVYRTLMIAASIAVALPEFWFLRKLRTGRADGDNRLIGFALRLQASALALLGIRAAFIYYQSPTAGQNTSDLDKVISVALAVYAAVACWVSLRVYYAIRNRKDHT